MSDLDAGTREATLPELVLQIEGLVDRRRIEHARKLLTEGLRRQPDSPDLLYLAAFTDWLEDHNDQALATVERVLAHDPDHYGARRLRGSLLEELGRHADAELAWIELLKDHPEDASCYGHYAELMLRMMHLAKARALAAEGLRHEPTDPRCLYVMALADMIDRKPSADERLATMTREHPEQARTAIALIIRLQEQGDQRGALRVAQGLLRSQPDSASYLRMVRSLKLETHWSLWPLYPVQRWGWAGSIGTWFVAVVGLRAMRNHFSDDVITTVALVWIAYVIYSWVWPRVLKRFI